MSERLAGTTPEVENETIIIEVGDEFSVTPDTKVATVISVTNPAVDALIATREENVEFMALLKRFTRAGILRTTLDENSFNAMQADIDEQVSYLRSLG